MFFVLLWYSCFIALFFNGIKCIKIFNLQKFIPTIQKKIIYTHKNVDHFSLNKTYINIKALILTEAWIFSRHFLCLFSISWHFFQVFNQFLLVGAMYHDKRIKLQLSSVAYGIPITWTQLSNSAKRIIDFWSLTEVSMGFSIYVLITYTSSDITCKSRC